MDGSNKKHNTRTHEKMQVSSF